jgi:acetolactate synthase I/II/III large subunit
MNTTVADYISSFLKSKTNEVFMLTGYGAMYLNDAIKKSGIKYYATRNEATAPIMAAAYSRASGKLGVACVTAGPGSTNAVPGLSEAYVDSSPVLILSGQVDLKHTTIKTKLKKIRTFGTAEINIEPIVKPLTKYAKTIFDPNEIKYHLEKAYHECISGRPGPVWLDIPLDVQSAKINLKKMKGYSVKKEKKYNFNRLIQKIQKYLSKSKKPIIVCGQGVKTSKTFKLIYQKFSKKLRIPIFFTRAANDLCSHKNELILGLAGIKGSKYCKNIMTQSDLVLNFGSRLAPQFVGHSFEAFKRAKIVSVDIEKDELFKKGCPIDLKICANLKFFIPELTKYFKNEKKLIFSEWSKYCENKNLEKISNIDKKCNPIDLYYFMNKLGQSSKKGSILVTDAGSNYYIGGQVWKFEKGQTEITSISNAAMGLSIPLAIGSSIASKNKQILAVTGDGSLELNIQELKTISHYNLNIKLFVINNGGYVSMHNWTDKFFEGRRVDNKKDTGEGTLNLKNIAKAFDLKYYKISSYKSIDKDLKNICKTNSPIFVEVVTDNKQTIFDSFKDK